MSLSKAKLENYRQELLTRRQRLATDLQAVTANMIDDDEMFADSVDQAAADTDRTVTVQMQNRDRGVLKSLDDALRRIDAGQFGECQNCSEEIGEARIRANPAATLCIDCKSELEDEQRRRI